MKWYITGYSSARQTGYFATIPRTVLRVAFRLEAERATQGMGKNTEHGLNNLISGHVKAIR